MAKGAKKDKDKKNGNDGDTLKNLVTKKDEDSLKNKRRTLSGQKEKELKQLRRKAEYEIDRNEVL